MAIIVVVVTACSTQKNTSQSRWWHSFNARYNTYYNGAVAYIEGSLEKENGNRDNFTELIPLYTVGNKQSRAIGKGNFDRAIEKSKKAIKLHSIKKRPEWNKNRRKTVRDIEWLSRREYNPFLWKAWLLMGRAQFHQGAFEDAASTFAYMSRLYQNQPAIYGRARAWLAKCYIEQDWMYDAEDVIRNMQRDSIDRRAQKEWNYTLANYYIKTGAYETAIPYLKKVIKSEMRRKQKAREWYLLGQLYALLGKNNEAYKAFQKVIRQNPPYELDFNARIAMSEVMAAKDAKAIIGRLKRMAVNDNNKDYLDQVYYAMGNIYLSQRDTLRAIDAYEKGNEKGTRNGIEKGVLLLRLGDLYWIKEKFGDAGRCYGTAIGLLDKDRKDYKQLSERSVILDELVPFTDAIHLQDSLQALAKMSEKERNEAIDRVIEALKKKEKEERRAQQEAEAQKKMAENSGMDSPESGFRQTPTADKKGVWYFYNPLTVSQGKAAFQKLWGKRENVDDWRRVNKTVVGELGFQKELTPEQLDSIERLEALQDSLDNVVDSAQNDPHKREYYLAQIPFTEEQMQESNAIIMQSLHKAGVIFKDKLDHLTLSEKHLRRLTDTYPQYEEMDDVFYHLFLLYSRKGEHAYADTYVAKLKADYPKSQWTTLLSDPYFKENAIHGVHIEDSLYAATYEAFKAGRSSEVSGNSHISSTRFPLGANRDKFIFIGGLSKLNANDADGCLEDMRKVVKDYLGSRLSEMAGMIINGVEKGRRLRGGRFDIGDVWDKRALTLKSEDSTAVKEFIADRNVDFAFMLVYHPDSVKENQMLYELAKFNFTNYIVRNFEIAIEDVEGLARMVVTGFRNFDEAHLYAQQLYANPDVVRQVNKARGIIISEKNKPLLGVEYSYKDYEKFYAKHFAPLKVTKLYLLTEPEEVTMEREKEIPSKEEDTLKETETEEGLNLEDMVSPVGNDTGITFDEDEQKKTEVQDTTTVTNDSKQTEPKTMTDSRQDEQKAVQSENEQPVVQPQIPVETSQPESKEVQQSEEPQPQENHEPAGFVFDDETEKSEKKQPSTPEPSTKKEDVKSEPVVEEPVQPSETEENGFVIVFDDEAGPVSDKPQSSPAQPRKDKEDDIEDEYYELGGF